MVKKRLGRTDTVSVNAFQNHVAGAFLPKVVNLYNKRRVKFLLRGKQRKPRRFVSPCHPKCWWSLCSSKRRDPALGVCAVDFERKNQFPLKKLEDSDERVEARLPRASSSPAPLDSSPLGYSLRSAKRRRVSPSESLSNSLRGPLYLHFWGPPTLSRVALCLKPRKRVCCPTKVRLFR